MRASFSAVPTTRWLMLSSHVCSPGLPTFYFSCLISVQVGDDQVAGGGVEEQEEVSRVVVEDDCQALL